MKNCGERLPASRFFIKFAPFETKVREKEFKSLETMNSEVLHEHNKFYKIVNGLESHMDYEMHEPSTVVFYHTFVPEELRGRGLAREIIKEGLDWAMAERLDIVPACSAVRRFIDMHDRYRSYLGK